MGRVRDASRQRSVAENNSLRALHEAKIIVIPAKAGAVSPAQLIQLLKNSNYSEQFPFNSRHPRLRGDDAKCAE